MLDGAVPKSDLTIEEDIYSYNENYERVLELIRTWMSLLGFRSRNIFDNWPEGKRDCESCRCFDDLKFALLRTYQDRWLGQAFRRTMKIGYDAAED